MIDSHCHLNDDALINDSDLLIQEAFENNIKQLLIVGWDLNSSRKAIEIAKKHEGCYAAVGIHPENLDGITDETLKEIESLALCNKEKVVAIGEIGLDYHWFKEESHRQLQKQWFIKQIKLANKLGLPVSIHARDAIEDTYKILCENPLENSGVLHCYSGSAEMLQRFLKLNVYFGFDGPITYKNSIEPKKCVQICPIERLLTETDCPYLTPVPFRGKPNKPSYIPYIVSEIANIKNLSIDEIDKKITENFGKLFHGERI